MTDSLELFIQRYALWYVAKFSTCSYLLEKAIVRRLKKKEIFVPQALPYIKETIHTCKRDGYIDDELYMRQQILKWQQKGYHHPVIFPKLLAIGYDRQAIQAALENFEDDITPQSEKILLKMLARKELSYQHTWDEETAQKKKQRALGMLARRGYPYESSLSILQKIGYKLD